MDIKLRRLAILVALAFICGCSNEKEQPKQPVAGDNRRDAKMEPTDSPFSDERSLEFDGPSFTDASLKALPHLDKIEVLTPANTAVTDEGCRELLRARSLVEIAIISDEITDRGLLAIQNLPQVWSLILDGTAVSDEGVAALAEMQKLFLLSLKNTRVVGHGVAKLRDNEQLSVYMDETPATDEGLSAFSGHPFLDVIYVRGCAVTESTTNVKKTSPRRLTVYGL